MEAIGIVRVPFKPGKILALSVVSDLHIDSSLCDWRKFRRVMAERNERYGENHRVILLGDTFDAVPWRDDRRFRPSGQIADLHGFDDFMARTLEIAAQKLKDAGVALDVITPGNHEDSALRRYGLDLTRELARRTGAVAAPYTGYISYTMGTTEAHLMSFVLAYHHGAWGGRYAKGYLGAKAFFSQLEGWHVAVYGHNHGSVVHRERKFVCLNSRHNVEARDVYIVNCASWVDSAQRHGYAIVRGHNIAPTGSPLIIAEHVRRGRPGPGGWTRIRVKIEV